MIGAYAASGCAQAHLDGNASGDLACLRRPHCGSRRSAWPVQPRDHSTQGYRKVTSQVRQPPRQAARRCRTQRYPSPGQSIQSADRAHSAGEPALRVRRCVRKQCQWKPHRHRLIPARFIAATQVKKAGQCFRCPRQTSRSERPHRAWDR